ncbi:radical SAM protein [Litorivicinus sp.]|nr:radical SAM protein [Litorivicinus sp.]
MSDEGYRFVNKGHHTDLETMERLERYTKLLSSGWEKDYTEYRRLWNALPASKEVREYPLLVDLETVSRCNLKCPMCPTVTDEFIKKRVEPYKKGLLDPTLAYKVIDEVAGHIYCLRLSWIGEPTLHPKLVDFVRVAKEKGIPEVSFLTNGYRLEKDYAKQLIIAGVDQITISIDGMDDTYNKIRAPLLFDETVKRVRGLWELKNELGLTKPVVKIQGVWPAIRDRAEEFYNLFSPIVDLIAFNPLIDYLHKDDDIIYEDGFHCPQHYQRVVISSSGQAVMCSSDDFVDHPIGDINEQTIYEIWHSKEFYMRRRTHEMPDGFKQMKACSQCFYPRKMAPSETTVINGRSVAIESYINRSQEVGT